MIRELTPWIPFLSLLIMALTFFRATSKDKKEENKEEKKTSDDLQKSILKLDIKLDEVVRTTNETKSDIKSMNKDLVELDRKVSINTRDIETAFVRIDELKELIQ